MRILCALVLIVGGVASRAGAQDVIVGGGGTTTALRPFDTTATAITESMRRDLARVASAEAAYYAANRRYAASAGDLAVVTVNGTVVTIVEADERSFRAVATNPRLPGAELEVVALTPPRGLTAAPADSRPERAAVPD
jgi:precorrin-3B methylase